MDWPEKINELAAERRCSIRQLAADLGVSQQFLSEVVRGVKPASPMLKIKVLDRFGYDLTRDILIDIFPNDIAEQIRKVDIERGIKRAEHKAMKNDGKEEGGL